MFLIDSFGIGIIMSRTYALHRDAAMPTDRALYGPNNEIVLKNDEPDISDKQTKLAASLPY